MEDVLDIRKNNTNTKLQSYFQCEFLRFKKSQKPQNVFTINKIDIEIGDVKCKSSFVR